MCLDVVRKRCRNMSSLVAFKYHVEVKVQLWRGWAKGGGCWAAVTSYATPPSLHHLLSFAALKLLTCLPLFPPSLAPSSCHPVSLPHSPFLPHLSLALSLSFLLLFLPSLSPPSSPLSYFSSDLPAFLSFLLFFLSLLSPPLPPFIKCGWWLAGSCWLASGGGYSFIIPPRLPNRLATMSQELNICHYYLLVLFDLEAAQWPVSGGFIPPPSVVRFKVDYSNPRAPNSTKSWSFLSFARSFSSLSPVPPAPPSKWNYIHLLAESITNVHTLTGVCSHIHAPVFCHRWRNGPTRPLLCNLCNKRRCVFDWISLGFLCPKQLKISFMHSLWLCSGAPEAPNLFILFLLH